MNSKKHEILREGRGGRAFYSGLRCTHMVYKRYRILLERAQRKIFVRITSAYKTVSTKAVQVIAEVIPIHLMSLAKKRLFNRRDGNTVQAKKRREDAREIGMTIQQ